MGAGLERDRLVLAQEGHLGVGEQPFAGHRVDQVAARAEHRQAGADAGEPAARAEQQHVLGDADVHRSGVGEVLNHAGEQLLQTLLGGFHEAVRVPGLGHSPAAAGTARDPVAFDDGDPVHEAGQGAGRGEPGERRAEDHGVAVTAASRRGPGGMCVHTHSVAPSVWVVLA
ncbi:hypothetical protein CJD44_39230 [Streptomyces sp. alain-838]|nr:hypothetical protein CJD44_39230 [Streptomyces sp. alain-838]